MFSSLDDNFNDYEIIFNKLKDDTLSFLKYNFNPSINVELIDDIQIQKINKEFRQIDKPTDVISLAYLEKEKDKEKIVHSKSFYVLGDIYISIDRAKKQAEEYGHSLKREMCFLFVHGLLHLLGFDHIDDTQREEMFKIQDKILNERGINR